MANIQPLNTPNNGKDLIDKLNEIIDWLNGVTDADRVTDIQVSGTNLVVTYINGDTDVFPLQDTTCGMATTEADGLISSNSVFTIDVLAEKVVLMNTVCNAIEEANDAIERANDIVDYYQNQQDSGGE